MDMEWEDAYRDCSTWGPVFEAVKDKGRQVDWPKGVTWELGRMYQDSLLCIPTSLESAVVAAHHLQTGHLGGQRLWREMQRRYTFAAPWTAERRCKRAQAECEICQACDPSRIPYKFPIEPTPISPFLMDSVALDLFALPEVTVGGQRYDTVALCVDRQSGWMVVTPHLYKGLTAEKVAKDMLRQWDIFGVPSVIKSDNGPHFSGAWWRTICAALGVRTAYSQAYHHQANGRAEVAGQLLMHKLSKLNAQEGMPWVELLPRALRFLHDAPGPTGLSPYEIVFGRQRPLAGLPYQPEHEAESATRFLARMRKQDLTVAKTLNEIQVKRVQAENARRRYPPSFKVGAKVWYLPERQPGTDKLDVRWKGPGIVLEQVGQSSYVVELKPGNRQRAHRSQLKPHVSGKTSGDPVPLYFFSEKGQPLDVGVNDWQVEKVLGHRYSPTGQLELLVHFWGMGPFGDLWEPWRAFFPRSNDLAIAYCRENGLSLNLADLLPQGVRPPPAGPAILPPGGGEGDIAEVRVVPQPGLSDSPPSAAEAERAVLAEAPPGPTEAPQPGPPDSPPSAAEAERVVMAVVLPRPPTAAEAEDTICPPPNLEAAEKNLRKAFPRIRPPPPSNDRWWTPLLKDVGCPGWGDRRSIL